MPLDRVGAQIAAVDSLYLAELPRRGRVAPSVHIEAGAGTVITGGLVLDSVPGLYRNILVFDFKSLYPSLIRTFNIDPLTHVPPEREAAAGPVVRTPSGAAFRADEPGILPELVARLWDERAASRARGDATGAQATKILMNSLFGVMGASASRLFSPPVANAITIAGQHVIRLAAEAVARAGHRVIYGDTDSLFVDAGESDPARAAARAETLRTKIGDHVAGALRAQFGVRSWLELEFEKVYARFWMPEVRGGATGSKKRYAGLVVGPRGETLELVGLEAVRRDWSEVARRFQRGLLDRVFHDQPVEDFIRGFVADLRAGALDDALAYRKAIRKPLDAYTKTTPPHVKAARKQAGGAGRIVTYVVTAAGPEALGETTAAPDYDHYVTQQLRPIADAVLRFLDGPGFDELVGLAPAARAEQLGLFAEEDDAR
jgi:DNA polymerase-2